LNSVRSAFRSRQTLVALVLAAGMLAQLALTYGSYVRPFYAHFKGLARLTSIERSAELSFGDDFAGYIEFLTKEIPTGARVIQPAFRQDPVFGHQGLMQYFLFPRQVMPCPTEITWDSCMGKFNGPATYILAIGDFPPAIDPRYGDTHLEYQPGRGVLIPAGGQGNIK
jgi:hypothetical protein